MVPRAPGSGVNADPVILNSEFRIQNYALLDHNAALEVGRAGIVVVVEAARPDGDQIAGLPTLACRQEADLVDLRAVRVFRMRIRVHGVRAGVVIDEQDPRTNRNLNILRTDAGGRDRDGVALNDGRWTGRGLIAGGTRTHHDNPNNLPARAR